LRALSAGRLVGAHQRVVVSLASAAVSRASKRNPKAKCNTGHSQPQFRPARGGHQRLHAVAGAERRSVPDAKP
jgi:hypothetical protein